MLPPHVYEEARLTATEHVQVEVVGVGKPAATADSPPGDHGLCRVHGRVAQVFRGRLRVGERVTFDVSCATRGSRVPMGGTLWTDMHALSEAHVVEGFFNREGERLVVAGDQIEIVPMVRRVPYCGAKGVWFIPALPSVSLLAAWWNRLIHHR